MKISLVAPVYNEQEKIQEFIHRSFDVLNQLSTDVEIILVDDCSSDQTVPKIQEIKPQYPALKVITLSENSGQHIATSVALKASKGDFTFMMDSDLQIAPEQMTTLFEEANNAEKWDIISACREIRSKKIHRTIGSHIISYLLKFITKSSLKDIGSTFKLIKRPALNKMLSHTILIQNLPILMVNLGFTIIETQISYNTNQDRKSHYKVVDLASAITLAFLNFSTGKNTLFILIIFGICSISIGGMLFGGTVVWGMINQAQLPTNLLLLYIFFILTGLMFLLMGIIAFKLERINKNLDFRKAFNQRIHDVD